MTDALQLLRDDHRRVKELFSQFDEADNHRTRGAIVRKALAALEIHAEIEEEIFYPAVRREGDAGDDLMNEAEEEHHVVKLLMAELRRMKPSAPHFDAKFTVLAENVKHHIEEEESEMLPKAAELGMSRMDELGAEMEERKAKLEKSGPVRRSPSSRSSNGTSSKSGKRTSSKSGSAAPGRARRGAKAGAAPGASKRRAASAAARTRQERRAPGRAPRRA